VAVFRPSARVRLQLRIDEMADTGTLEGKLAHPAPVGATAGRTLPATKAGARAALESNFQRRVTLNQNRASLAVDALARERSELDRERQSLQAITTEGQAQAVPDAIDESRGTQDDLNVIFSVLPRSCSIERNPLKDADTARLTFDFRDVPVDPRIVRACFVAISMGTVSADDYAAGMEGQTRDDGSLRSLVAHESGEEMRLERTATPSSSIVAMSRPCCGTSRSTTARARPRPSTTANPSRRRSRSWSTGSWRPAGSG
jgi:hypothetical protein